MGFLQDVRQLIEQGDSDEFNADSIVEKLIKNFGGCNLYIPYCVSNCKNTKLLQEKLGEKVFTFLSQNLGGQRVYVPKKDTSKRNGIIRQEFYQGQNGNNISLNHNLSRRQVHRILNAS